MPVPVQTIAYVESKGHEQLLHLVGWSRKELYARMTMLQLEELLLPQGFLRSINNFLSTWRICNLCKAPALF